MMGKLASIESTISNIPKAELHVHLAGTLEPSLMFEIAERNKIKLKYATVEELKSKYSRPLSFLRHKEKRCFQGWTNI